MLNINKLNGGGKIIASTLISKNITTLNIRAVVCAIACTAALSVSLPANADDKKDDQKVYVCTGSMAYAYHTHRDCRGLQRCTAEIKTETAKEARKEGRQFCKLCAKRRGAKTLPMDRSGKKVSAKEAL